MAPPNNKNFSVSVVLSLLHHHANVLRYSARAQLFGSNECLRRLDRAEKLLNHALDQPWISGQKDEHPGHLLTTLGLVRLEMGRRSTDDVERNRLTELAQQTLEDALVQAPMSRHTRQALADSLLAGADRCMKQGTELLLVQAAKLASRVLQLLELEPTGEPERWYRTKGRAAELFGTEAGILFLQRLQHRGVEDGYLLVAERCVYFDNLEDAIGWLRPITEGSGAARHVRSARRLAQLYVRSEGHWRLFDERYRLLIAVEASGTPTTPDEEYQLACLEYQLGRPAKGGTRFAGLRAGQRHQQVSVPTTALLDDSGAPRVFSAQIKPGGEGERGWMDLFERGSRQKLFSVPFFARHFGRVRAGAAMDVAVRFDSKGPNAIPPRKLSDG